MFSIFKKQATAPQPPTAPTPAPTSPDPHASSPASPQGSGIAYYPDLIGNLVADHHSLLHLHNSIKQAFARHDLATVSQQLKEFGTLLRNHLLTENMRLYIYLQQQMAGDEINTTLVRSFRKEMDGIAKTALDFLARYESIENLSSPASATFMAELDTIGQTVLARMKREEDLLYPLYAENY